MAVVNYLPLRSRLIYTSAGTLVPDTYLYTVSSSIPAWTNTIAASTLGISTLTLANSTVSLGLSTNSTTVGFSQGNYAAGYWSTASGVSASTVKRVNMSASGQYQTIANQSTNSLYYSNNSGSTWSTLSGVVGPITDAGLSASSQNMIVGTASTNVYVSNNYASTFTAKNLGAPFGYFQFENNLTDTQGNMTLTNYGSAVTYVAGQVGTNAVRLTNTLGAAPLQYLRAPWNAPQAFTISGWFNAATVAVSTQEDIIAAYNEAIMVAVVNTTCYMRMPSGSGASNIQYTGTISAGTWNSFTMIFQTNGLCSSYLNNILLGSFMNSGGFGTNINSGGIVFGTNDNLTGIYPFNGSLDDIRIFPYAISPVGPNLYFPFENSTADVVGGSTVTVTGTPTYVTGLSTGSAIRLTNTLGSAATQYLRVAYNAPSALTITGWFNATSVSTSYASIILAMYTGGIQVYIATTTNYLTFAFPTGSGTTGTSFANSTAIQANTWYNFMIVYQANGLCAGYLNGTLIGTYSNSGGFGTMVNTNLLGLGTSDSSTSNPFNGSLDDIRIYNTANLYPTATISKNYPDVAVSGNGAYQLAGTTDGELFLSADSGSSWTVQPSAKILGSWQSLSLSHTGQYMAATASTTQITPNQTSLAAYTWTQNGVTWKASASTTYSTAFVYYAFNNTAATNSWASAASTYNGAYTGSVSTTVQGIGAVLGEWLQIQASIPMVLQSYTYAIGGTQSYLPKNYYIVGSNDGSTWYPLQFMTMSTSPFTSINLTACTTYLQMNYTGTQTIQGQQTVSGTTTSYSYTTSAYTYFRIVVTSVYTSGTLAELGEFYPIFTNGSSTSINYGASWAPGSTAAQAVSVPQYTQTTPNQTSLAAYTWTQNGVNWTVSASTYFTALNLYAYLLFNISYASYNGWASAASTYNGAYTGSVSTTIQGIGATTGEWFQLQSNLPVVLQSYTYASGGLVSQLFKNYYIVGSNDGSTWYPLHNAVTTTNPLTAPNTSCTSYLQMNYTGTQTIQGNVTGSVTTTSYSYTTNAYTYFRIVTTAVYTSATVVEIGEFYPIFVIPTTTTSTGSVLSNDVVSQSGSGQYAIGLDSNMPLARLTLDNTAADLLGALTAATGAGTVTYSSSIVKVGTHSAFFNNVPGSTTPANYLKYTVPASLNQPSALTMSYWIYPTSFGLQGQNVGPISLGNDPNASINFYFTPSGVVSLYWTSTTSPGSSLTSATTISLNTWTHFAFTFGSGVINMYINGACVVSAAATGNLCGASSTNINTIYVGTTTSTFASFLGYIDDVRIYTTALSSLQIANFYSNPAYQAVKVSSRTIAGLSSTAVATVPALAGLNANVVAGAASFTGQYMVLVTAGSSNNVYYSVDYGVTFTALTIGSTPMISCAISADGSYINVANATTSYRLNSNSTGYTLAIGSGAGAVNQANNAIAIGNQAGAVNQSANSIILNASGLALNSVESGFYVSPILTASAASASSSIALLGYGSDSQVVQSSVTVLSNGNVGMGTTNPATSLEIYTNNGVGGTTQINVTSFAGGATSTNTSAINLKIQGAGGGMVDNIISGQYNSSGVGTYSLAFKPSGTTVMTMLGSGNVGIGTANPAQTLDVNGAIARSGLKLPRVDYGTFTTGTTVSVPILFSDTQYSHLEIRIHYLVSAQCNITMSALDVNSTSLSFAEASLTTYQWNLQTAYSYNTTTGAPTSFNFANNVEAYSIDNLLVMRIVRATGGTTTGFRSHYMYDNVYCIFNVGTARGYGMGHIDLTSLTGPALGTFRLTASTGNISGNYSVTHYN